MNSAVSVVLSLYSKCLVQSMLSTWLLSDEVLAITNLSSSGSITRQLAVTCLIWMMCFCFTNGVYCLAYEAKTNILFPKENSNIFPWCSCWTAEGFVPKETCIDSSIFLSYFEIGQICNSTNVRFWTDFRTVTWCESCEFCTENGSYK